MRFYLQDWGKKFLFHHFFMLLFKYKWFSKKDFWSLNVQNWNYYNSVNLTTKTHRAFQKKKKVKLIAHHASKIEFTANSIHIVYN